MQRKYTKGLITLGILALSTMLSAQVMALTIAGSTTVQKRILEPCQEGLKSKGIELTIIGNGSGNGFKQLLEGKVGVAASSVELSELLAKNNLPNDGTYKESILTVDDIVPFVNAAVSVTKLTKDQIADIYTGKITNWKDVGGEDIPIVVVTSKKGTGTQAAFEELVLKKQDTVASARTVASDREQIPLVARMKGAIGYGSKSLITGMKEKVKIVDTSKIVRPLSLITKGEPDAETQKLLDYLKANKKSFK